MLHTHPILQCAGFIYAKAELGLQAGKSKELIHTIETIRVLKLM